MDIQAIMALNRDPMLTVKNNRIVSFNPSFAKAFPRIEAGSPAVNFLPEYILTERSDSFVCTAQINGLSCSVSALRSDDSLLLSLSPLSSGSPDTSLLSDGLMAEMLTALGNMGLSIDRLLQLQERNGEQCDEMDKSFRILNRNYFNLRKNLSNLNTAVSVSRGSIPFLPRQMDLTGLCSGICDCVAFFMRDQGISIEFSSQHDQLYARVDPAKVERIILNLLSNSCRHTGRGGTVKLGLSVSGSNVVISVDDEGCGIPGDVLQNIFSRWEEKITPSNLTSVSAGLGLGIARSLAEEHGGALIIESRENVGTSVRVLLPINSSSTTSFNCPTEEYRTDIMTLLTELSCVLDSSFYGSEYMD